MGQYLEQQIGFSGNRRDPTGVWGFIPARSSSAMDKNLAGHIRLTEWELIFLIGNSTGAEGGLCSQWINYGSLGFPEGVDVGVFSGYAGKYPYISVAPRQIPEALHYLSVFAEGGEVYDKLVFAVQP